MKIFRKRIKQIFLAVLSLIILLFNISVVENKISATSSTEKPLNIYLFYGEGCPHCAKERSFLEEVKPEYGEKINIYEFEIYYNQENVEKFVRAAEIMGIEAGGVPFLIIGDNHFVGYGGDYSTGLKIEEQIEYCLKNSCEDLLAGPILGIDLEEEGQEEVEGTDAEDGNAEIPEGKNLPDQTSDDQSKDEQNVEQIEEAYSPVGQDSSHMLDVPVFGTIDLKGLSIPAATIIIAFMDGFNPCAMWILIFLITMLINMKDRKKLYILGSVFIFTSGLVYFIFLAAWFNIFQFIGMVNWIKIAVGLVAIVSGISHIKSGLSSKGGCRAVDDEKRESIMNRIKKIINEKKFILALFGIAALAVSVNLIELVCSAGLPAIYTNLLSSVEMSALEYYLYLLLYILIFMLDDLLIFFIAVKSFKVTGITNKYSKWSSLIGGGMILIIGLLLIFKPDALLFG